MFFFRQKKILRRKKKLPEVGFFAGGEFGPVGLRKNDSGSLEVVLKDVYFFKGLKVCGSGRLQPLDFPVITKF